MYESVLAKLEALEPLVEATGKPEIKALATFLYERIAHPDSYLVFLGETSSGKSSIINGLIGESILPVKACPSTGAITEIAFSDMESPGKYMAINKDATARWIDREEFLKNAEFPDSSISRLKYCCCLSDNPLRGLRVFDTPGYGSIVEEHEEVLKDFLPNSDIVVYVVNYHIGIQEDDYLFLRFLKELLREDVDIILLINRCPVDLGEDDRRLREVKKYASDIMGKDPIVFTVPETPVTAGEIYALPKCLDFWSYVGGVINAEERLQRLENVFDEYVIDLYERCDAIIQARYASAKMSDAEYNSLLEAEIQTAFHIRQAVDELINPTFDKLVEDIPIKLDSCKDEIVARIEKDIDETKTGEMEDMISYTNVHLLPFTISRVCSDQVEDYIDVVLTDLNARVDDYIEKELIKFSNEISIRLNSNLDIAVQNVSEKIIQKLAANSLAKYFVQFGGAGGANAGIANAASHLLKEVGHVFGKTFSRETHNALKHTLKKIGATSMKTVGTAVAVILELLSMAYDYSTWKSKLKKKVRKGLDEWYVNTAPQMIKDINNLRDNNIETIMEIASMTEASFEKEKAHDADACLKDVRLSEMVGKVIKTY